MPHEDSRLHKLLGAALPEIYPMIEIGFMLKNFQSHSWARKGALGKIYQDQSLLLDILSEFSSLPLFCQVIKLGALDLQEGVNAN